MEFSGSCQTNFDGFDLEKVGLKFLGLQFVNQCSFATTLKLTSESHFGIFSLSCLVSQDHKHHNSKEIVAFMMINHECCSMHCFQLYWCLSHDEVVCSKCQQHTHHKCIGMLNGKN